jgi:hypothetical protein
MSSKLFDLGPWFRAVVGALALGTFAVAHASLSSPISVSLLAPGGITTDGTASNTDTTPISAIDNVNSSQSITPGDGSNIGAWMLSTESIGFLGNSILLDIAAGAADATTKALSTGYLGVPGEHARYLFAGLDIAGSSIIGFDGSFTGLDSPLLLTDFVTLIDAHTLSVDLDSLIFRDPGTGQSDALAQVTINLLTRSSGGNGNGGGTVPEPATPALVAVALLVGLGVRRLKRAPR